MSENKAKLFKKILAVQKVLEPLEKSGKNDFHRYRYATAGDVLLPVSRACNEHGLVVVADVIETKIHPERAAAEVTVKLTVFDSETGESHSITAPGYAEDWSYKDSKPVGDKAVYKAVTGGTKYAVRSFFCLPSEDDPERPERQTSTPSATSSKPTKPTTVHTLQPVHSDPVTNKPVTGNSGSPTAMEQTSAEMLRVGWTATEGRQFLEQNFGKRARKELTATELHWFLDYLRSLPSMSARAPAVTPSVTAA